MAIGKSKKYTKSKGTGKRKQTDPMGRKEWYDVIAPAVFAERKCCKTLVNRTVGMKLSSDSLMGRIFEVNLDDLMKSQDVNSYRNIELRVDEVRGRTCLTNFHGMALTTDKLRSLVKKWCSLIETSVLATTTDGFQLRVFVIGFTDRVKERQHSKNCYAQTSQIRTVQKRMAQMTRDVITKHPLHEVVKKFIAESPAQDIPKACHDVFPLRDCYIRKVKMVKAPKFDAGNFFSHVHHDSIPLSLEETGTALGSGTAVVEEAA